MTSPSHLILPHQHPLSHQLTYQIATFTQSLPRGVISCNIKSPGIVDLQLQASTQSKYHSRTWTFRIGGIGIGDKPNLAKLLGGDARAPIAARFIHPFFAMQGIDESGFVDASFWKNSIFTTKTPTLLQIAQTALEWINGTHLTDNDAILKWQKAAQHTFNKVNVIQQYQTQCKHPALFTGLLLPEWIVPKVRSLLKLNLNQTTPSSASVSTTTTTTTTSWLSLMNEISPGIYAFDLFTPEFCTLLINEIDAFEATTLPRRRPNTMNRLGLVVNEIGLEPLMTTLLESIMAPLFKELYPNEMVSIYR